MTSKILIVDDENEVRSLIAGILEDEGHHVLQAENTLYAMHLLKNNKFDLVFLDLWMDNNDMAGIDLLKKIKKIDPFLCVIMISGHGSIDIATNAIKIGAYDFIEKPFTLDRLLLTTTRALELVNLERTNARIKQKFDFDEQILGASQSAQKIKKFIEKIAPTNSRVLISSEIGCCADTVAYQIHKKSSRADETFFIFNCNNSDFKGLENALFGNKTYSGILEKSHNGTVLLENITALPDLLQKKLANFLQTGFIENTNEPIDVRILAHTTYPLEHLFDNEIITPDLIYKLNVCSFEIQPLRERKEDIKIAIDYYLSKSHELFTIHTKQITNATVNRLMVYDWPGNFRQLRNTVENMLITASTENKNVIDVDCIPTNLMETKINKSTEFNVHKILNLKLKDAKIEFEKEYIRLQLHKFSGNITATADFLEIDRTSLHRKLKLIMQETELDEIKQEIATSKQQNEKQEKLTEVII